MTHVTTSISVSENKKMKKEYSGPRAETLAIIRQFARSYKFEPKLQPNMSDYLVN